MAVTTDPVVTEDGARTLPPPRFWSGKIRKGLLFFLGTLFVLIAYLGFRFGPDATVAYRRGFFDKSETVAYTATSEQNLKAIHTALLLYHSSEGQLPMANGWMDAIRNRLQTANLKPGEGEKKLRRPGVENGLGYAMNDAASTRFTGDLDPKTVLVFESKDVRPNAHGDPRADALGPEGKTAAITVDGTIVRF